MRNSIPTLLNLNQGDTPYGIDTDFCIFREITEKQNQISRDKLNITTIYLLVLIDINSLVR